jgi:predicted MFS family arabinose efflux permease
MIALNLTGAAGGLVFAAAGGLTGALAGRLLLGLGMSANLIGPLVLFTRWFRKGEFATFSGLLLAMASLGNMLAATPLGLAARAVGWRTTFVGLAGINLVLVAVFWIFVQAAPPGWVPETNDRGGRTWPGARASLRHMLSSWTYWAIALSAGLRYGVFAAIQAVWIGPFLLLDLSLPEVTAGNLMLMLSVGVLVGAPLSGIVSDRLVPSRKATVVTGLALMAASVLTLALWPADAPLVALGAVLFGCGLFSGSAQVMYVHIKEVMPSYMSGVAMTGVNFFVMAGAGGFSHGVGGLLGRGGELGAQLDYQGAFLFLAASAALASVLYLTGRDSRRV